tara:strand:+ start:54 stop:278 length:225 start_codon:yes stop_codon:yes gene_type:complete
VATKLPKNIGDKMSKIEDEVCAKIMMRAEIGKRKYGVTMERDDLTLVEWMRHLSEELMDALVYIEKQIQMLERK